MATSSYTIRSQHLCHSWDIHYVLDLGLYVRPAKQVFAGRALVVLHKQSVYLIAVGQEILGEKAQGSRR